MATKLADVTRGSLVGIHPIGATGTVAADALVDALVDGVGVGDGVEVPDVAAGSAATAGGVYARASDTEILVTDTPAVDAKALSPVMYADASAVSGIDSLRPANCAVRLGSFFCWLFN
ncbi:MAG: hypothetical protein M3N46_14825 [Actinomycetota bacterium]|nr:hypothetical protein [Actinomycetota bacterium]